MCGRKGICIECADSDVRVPIGWDCIEGDDPESAYDYGVSDEELDEFLSGGPIVFEG